MRVDFSAFSPVEFPCGRVKMDYTEGKAEFNIRLIGGNSGGRGFSPWQVRSKESFTKDCSDRSGTALPAPARLLC